MLILTCCSPVKASLIKQRNETCPHVMAKIQSNLKYTCIKELGVEITRVEITGRWLPVLQKETCCKYLNP